MKLENVNRFIAIVALLAIQILNSASAASHREAPQLMLDTVEFEGSGPLFDAGGDLVAVDRVRFSGVTADGHWIEGSGKLSLLEQPQDNGELTVTGIIGDILGRVGHADDSTSDSFTGQAQVSFDAIGVDQQRFDASGSMRLQLEIQQPALVREFDIVADAIQNSDGGWSARFHGEDRLGLGVHIEGFYVTSNEWGVWADAEVVQLKGDVEALAWLDSGAGPASFEDKIGAEQFVFDDTDGAERLYFVYDDRGRLSHIKPSAEVEGRFSARLTLHIIGDDAISRDGLFNVQVGDVIASASERTPEGLVSGRAEVFFSGVGKRDGAAVTIKGTAEFHFEGDTTDGSNSLLAGRWKQLSATIEDTATGGTVLFEDISGRVGHARIVGKIDAAGQVDLSGGLGQITILDQDLSN